VKIAKSGSLRRLTAWVALLAVSGSTLPLCAEGEIRVLTDVRAEVEARHQGHTALSVELTDGTRLTGSVAAVRKSDFAIVTGLHAKRSIAYSKIQAVVDPETGQTVALVRQTPPPTGRMVSSRTRLIVVIVVAAAATVYLVAYLIASHVK
jgi:hypothetical protein